MYNVYFENRYGNRRLFATVEKSEILTAIKTELNNINPNYISYYTRYWFNNEKEEIIYDVGSHSEFFIAVKVK